MIKHSDVLLMVIDMLLKENHRLKKRNTQLEQICKIHARALNKMPGFLGDKKDI